ncbi:MAG: hypothetical protein JW932_17150 [Deltaproteobacteria bacterium]|nr:hypothetical protein [Deltaproteobacteria bacterium]
MIKTTTKNSNLRVITGHYPIHISMGFLDIVASPEKMRPFALDAMVFEEDTFLVLSADKRVRDPQKPLIHVLTEVIELKPETPGTVLTKGKGPFRMLAVIHDLDQEPTWQEEWIKTALKNIFLESEKRKLRSIAIPFIGTVYGNLGRNRFIELLWKALNQFAPRYLKRLWIIVPKETPRGAFDVFQKKQNRNRESLEKILRL